MTLSIDRTFIYFIIYCSYLIDKEKDEGKYRPHCTTKEFLSPLVSFPPFARSSHDQADPDCSQNNRIYITPNAQPDAECRGGRFS